MSDTSEPESSSLSPTMAQPTLTRPVESDLWIPKPGPDETWADHTIHTHYFGFNIAHPAGGGPAIGVFIYIRCQPVFNLCSGGAMVFSGMNNIKPLDVDHCNYVNTMPYPEFGESHRIETKNGLRVEFIELGKTVRITYASADGLTHFDVTQEAVTPLLVRGHVFPSEDVATDPSQEPGGSEQYMACEGYLTLNSITHPVKCTSVRDRSWRQVRGEDEVPYPPVGWSPMYFGPHLSFNQVGYDSTQVWDAVFAVDKEKANHYFAWVLVDGKQREVVRVKREITRWHPELYAAVEQKIEAEDDTGVVYKFKGEALAMAHLPSWPNSVFIDSVYKWTNEATGDVAYCTYQEAWFAKYQRLMRGKISKEGKFVGERKADIEERENRAILRCE